MTYRGRHRAPRPRRKLPAALLALAVLLALPLSAARPAHASTLTLGDRVLNAAETQAGCWYRYGSAGPCSQGYDCSGTVYAAARRLGIWIPRTTYGMLAGSTHLYRIPLSSARRGDLLFYSSGHVEIATIWYHTSYGAQQTGTRLGWHRWSAYWHPTMAMRFR